VTDPLNHETVYTFDDVGRLIQRLDPNGNDTDFTYYAGSADIHQVIASVGDGDSAPTTYEYDENGNLSQITDANNHVTTLDYWENNQPKSVTDPLNRTWSITYDDVAGTETNTLPSGGTVTQSFDVKGRLTTVNYSDSTPDVSFTYDANDNPATMTDGISGTVSYAFDVLSRLESVTRGTSAFTYTYFDDGMLKKRTYPNGDAVTYTYETDNRLDSVTSGNKTVTYDYTTSAGKITRTLPSANGYVETTTFDRAGRVSKLTNKKGSSTLSKFDYTLDDAGNPTQIITTTETIDLTYDDGNRLTKVCYLTNCPSTGGALTGITYDYDDVGNLIERQTHGTSAATTSYLYDAADELCWSVSPASQSTDCSVVPTGGTDYDHDANGNVTRKGSRTFTYDLASRLVSTTNNSTTYTYSYDGHGNRVSSTSAGVTTSFAWDINAAVALLATETTGSTTTRHVYGSGPEWFNDGTNHFFLTDALGSVANITSGLNGATEATYTYEPYGSIRTKSGLDPLSWTRSA
jgi:YD repeat-containing protein